MTLSEAIESLRNEQKVKEVLICKCGDILKDIDYNKNFVEAVDVVLDFVDSMVVLLIRR